MGSIRWCSSRLGLCRGAVRAGRIHAARVGKRCTVHFVILIEREPNQCVLVHFSSFRRFWEVSLYILVYILIHTHTCMVCDSASFVVRKATFVPPPVLVVKRPHKNKWANTRKSGPTKTANASRQTRTFPQWSGWRALGKLSFSGSMSPDCERPETIEAVVQSLQPNIKVCRLLGQVTRSKLWFKSAGC